MKENTTKEKGNRGEELACEFLLTKNYSIRKRNWRFGKYEVDIIAQDDNTLVFVEVKYRISHNMKEPIIIVSTKQRFNLIKVANYYIDLYSVELESRFDILEIVEAGEKVYFHHCIDAFTPDVNQV